MRNLMPLLSQSEAEMSVKTKKSESIQPFDNHLLVRISGL
jgi:hypothetical protein